MSRFAWVRDIECILFDWGGTLCRSERERDAMIRGIGEIAALLGVDDADTRTSISASLGNAMQQAYLAADADPEHREIDAAQVLQAWGEQMGLARRKQWDVARLVEKFWKHWQGCIEPLAKPVPVLAELRRRGYRLGLLSNVAAPSAVCRGELQRLGLLEFFECCTFSSELRLRKPHPAVFKAALDGMCDGQALDPGQVVYVGDSPRWDVGGAKAAGMRAVLFRSRATDWPEEDYERYRPDAVIDRLDELLLLFLARKATAG